MQEKLKSLTKTAEAKPSFHAGKKITYYKDDLKIYSKSGESTSDLAKLINPLKWKVFL